MRVATFVMALPKEAKNTSLLIGLWNTLDVQKVPMIRIHPNNEKTEQVRSIMAKTSSCLLEISFSAILSTRGSLDGGMAMSGFEVDDGPRL